VVVVVIVSWALFLVSVIRWVVVVVVVVYVVVATIASKNLKLYVSNDIIK
jgi:hypothetical protein